MYDDIYYYCLLCINDGYTVIIVFLSVSVFYYNNPASYCLAVLLFHMLSLFVFFFSGRN